MDEIDCDEVKNGEKAAFPGKYGGGLTKREWFAGMALQGLLACDNVSGGPMVLATESLRYADELLKQLAGSDGALEQIKDRKGKMVDGVFVKDVQELNLDAVQGEHEPGEYVFHEVQEWRNGLAANFRYLDRVLDDNILMFSNICTDCKESEPYTKDHGTLRDLSSDIFAAMDKMKKFLAERQKERAK